MGFADRTQAGRNLARALGRFADEHPIVLALPRGGVPVAYEVARALDAPLDVLLVRKIGVPGHEELALGAVVEGVHPVVVVNDVVAKLAQVPAGYFEQECDRQFEEIERRRERYCGGRPPLDVEGRAVLVVDDGIATGATARAALRGLRQAGARRLVLAIPVAPGEALDALRHECDELVCLETPEPFVAVGLHYDHFDQTSDEEVVRLLGEADADPSIGK